MVKTLLVLEHVKNIKKKINKKNLFVEGKGIKPINTYAKCKNEFHLYLKEKKINYKWLRIFYLFGEGENKSRLFPSAIKSIKNKKKFFLKSPYFKTDFLYVETVAKIIEKLMNKNISGEFNICHGKSIRLINILKLISKYFRNDIYNFKYKDNSKIENEEITGSIKKLKQNKSYIKSDLKKNIYKYLKSFKNVTP